MKNSTNLFELQLELQNAIKNKNLPQNLKEALYEKPPISISLRVQIYQEAYTLRLKESLRDDFPRVEEALDGKNLGGKDFENLVLEFIQLHPSKFKNLAEYSGDFPEFLKTKSHLLYELAIKDWLEILSTQAPEPSHSLSAVEVQEGVLFAIKRHPASFTQKIDEKYFLSFRIKDEIQFKELTQKEKDLLDYLRNRKSLGEVSSYSLNIGFSEMELQALFLSWMTQSIIYCERI
ncbi:MAG: HvfC/BufC family peptide modification chaperone [Pseudobdellovibrionaceae bacterium]